MADTFEQAIGQALDDLDADALEVPESSADTEQAEGVDSEPDENGELDGEPDEDEEADDTPDDAELVELSDGQVVKLPDGTEMPFQELRDSLLRQSDYTKKTQEAAEVKREAEELRDKLGAWYQERAENPVGWVSEIISETSDPTATLAQAIVGLAQAGGLDPEFVKTFGIDTDDSPIAGTAKQASDDDRISRLEREREQEKADREAAASREQAMAEYRKQYAEIVQSEALTFDDVDAETRFKAELAGFARDNQITDLRVAYDAMSRRAEREQRAASDSEAKRAARQKVVDRKRKQAAITPKGGTGAGQQTSRASSFEESAGQAVDALFKKLGTAA